MTKYQMLLNILDRMRQEAESSPRASAYLPPEGDTEAINQARGRAYIHLYLKVTFGLLEFEAREHFLTDGKNDGGIDGYYIDSDRKRVYFVQSKFRTTESNFITKKMTVNELLSMDLRRILEGYPSDEKGNCYNGKILQLQRELAATEDIARYKYKVVILANLVETSPTMLARLFDYSCEVIDYEATYKRLVFPVIAGTYFNASDLVIHLDLSNKNAGSKISYTVETQYGECEITVLFVPTGEIAKTFHKYKNSILKFNPRSYLEFEGQKVNTAIRNTILQGGKNEFALYNNGITMISEETNLNERIGQRNKACLNVTNPQIINGGQTAYTLSRIWEENEGAKAIALFEGKEVLLKVITVNSYAGMRVEDKLKLIEAISIATNAQTPVISADRYSNEDLHIKLQEILFDEFELLYERKRGEFIDGISNSYITRGQVIERNLLIRIFLAANGFISISSERKAFLNFSQQWTSVPTRGELDRFCFGYFCYQSLDVPKRPNFPKRSQEVSGKIYGMTRMYLPDAREDLKRVADEKRQDFLMEWNKFIETGPLIQPQYIKKKLDRSTMTLATIFDIRAWFLSNTFESDVKTYFDTKRS